MFMFGTFLINLSNFFKKYLVAVNIFLHIIKFINRKFFFFFFYIIN